MSFFRYLVGIAITVILTACGGGGGNPGTPSGAAAGSAAVSSSTPTAASFVFTLDKSSIINSGSDKALLTVTALDAARNVVSGVPVSVSVDTGIYTAVASTTDATGQVSGSISIGGNKTNRNITATINVGGQTGSAVVAVTGSQIALTPLPATPSPGAGIQVSIKATDANGVGISGASVQLGGTLGFTQSVATDSSGNATATLGAVPTTVGTYSITAAGLGVTALRAVQVVSTTAGGIPDAVGTITAASLQITPTSIFPNMTGSTTNRANLRAIFQDASNQAIQNVRVRFEIVPPGLGSGEQISTGTATVYTDVGGVAIADYISGVRTSPTNGVIIRACYGATDASIAGALCPNWVTQTLTVGGQAISIALGDNNELSKGNNNLTYIKKFVVLITDSNGNPVSNAVVSASVDITHYGKGWGYSDPYYINNLATLLTTPPNTSSVGINTTDMPLLGTPGKRVWCPNEDTNRNGFLDTNEDINHNGVLDSRKADVILSFVGANTTAADGTATIQVQYPQNVATWLAYTIKVGTGVGGSEGTAQKSYLTKFVDADELTGSFRTPPYGVNSCIDPN